MRTVVERYNLLYRIGVLLLMLALGLICYGLALSSWNTPVELGAYDVLLRMRPAQTIRNDIVILAIDAPAVAELGPLPWSRATHARILRALQEAGARYIVYDMLFPQPDTERPGADRAFWRAMTLREDAFLPMIYDPFKEPEWDPADLRGLILLERFVQTRRITYTSDTPMYKYYYFSPPWADFVSAARGVGTAVTSSNVSPVVRQAQLASLTKVEYPVPSQPLPRTIPSPKLMDQTAVAPGLPLLVAQAVMEVEKDLTEVDFGDSIAFLADLQPYVRIPIDDAGRMVINYAGPVGSYPYHSAIDLLEDRLDPALLDDKIVFVGITGAMDTLSSTVRTPFGYMPRVEATANSTATILDRSYISRTRQDALAAILVLAIILGLLLAAVPRLDLAPTGFVLSLAYIVVAVLALTVFRHALPVMPALILALLGSAAAAFLKPVLFVSEEEVVIVEE